MNISLRFARAVVALAPAVALIASQLWPGTALPLPLFSRSQQVACEACHTPAPELNAAGRAFLQSGYRTLEGDAERRTGEIPIGVVGNVGVESTPRPLTHPIGMHEFMQDRGEPAAAIEVHGAGTVARDVSYHLQVNRDEDHPNFETKSAYAQVNDLAGTGINVKTGLSQSELVFLSNERRMTLHPYLSPITLEARGFELNGGAGPWGLAAGMTTSGRDRLEDSYLSFRGGAGTNLVAGRMLFDRQDSNISFHAWLQHLQAVVGGEFSADRTVATLGYVFDRFDDRPAAGIHQHNEYFLLDVYRPLDPAERWWVSARYEHEYRTPTVLTREEDHQLGVLDVRREVNANAKVGVEVARTGDNVSGPRTSTLSAYVDVAF